MRRLDDIFAALALISLLHNVSPYVWSEWSEWTGCSSTCGEGVHRRSRMCVQGECADPDTEYKLCSLKKCPGFIARYRRQQCIQQRSIPVAGTLYKWKVFHDHTKPCAVICIDKKSGRKMTAQAVVPDGVRCTSDSDSVCLNGKCRSVICTGLYAYEECRVCLPGNECSISKNSTSQWKLSWGQCLGPCGKGKRSSIVKCVDTDTNTKIDDDLCDKEKRPASLSKECHDNCGFSWRVSEWDPCDVSCGSGLRQRRVDCIDETVSPPTVHKDFYCSETKPDISERCNAGSCPTWHIGEWTPCSTTCGHGVQYRIVACAVDSPHRCDEESKPATSRQCEVDMECAMTQAMDYPNDESWDYDPFADLEFIGVPEDVKKMGISTIPRYIASDWSDCSVTCGPGERTRSVQCRVYRPFQQKIKDLPDDECPVPTGKKPYPYAKCFPVECGESTDAKLIGEDKDAGGSLVLETDDDEAETNAIDESINGGDTLIMPTTNEEYSWDSSEYVECSKSCLKGFQETKITCRNTSGDIVSPKLCVADQKPRTHIRECNDVPCPPRWKVSEFSPCSAVCGGGYQDRKVYCVQEVAANKTERIPDYKCPPESPISIRVCNSKYCPAHWTFGDWSKCSVTCGMGVQTREVYCIEKPLTNKMVNVSDLKCVDAKPPTTRHCKTKQCFENWSQQPAIKSRNETFIQVKRVKKIHLYVGGSAILLPRQYVKIRCPVRNIDKKLLFWTKNNRLVPTVGRVRVSRYGVLKIRKTDPEADKGVYSCLAEDQRSDITLDFSNKKKARKLADEVIKHIDYSQNNVNKYKKNNLSLADRGLVRDIATVNTFQTVYTTTGWTPCPDMCGPGHQTRKASCVILTGDYVKYVSEKYCKRKSLRRPVLTQKCSEERECPSWEEGAWSNCSSKHCSKEGYGTQRRDVGCFYKNSTVAKEKYCARNSKPESKRICKNKDCKATLYIGKWSKCRPRCGTITVKSRILTCVWQGSKQPAYGGCKGVQYPVTHKPCKPRPCKSRCEDRSRFCNTVRLLNMCRYGTFSKNCCASCRYQRNSSVHHKK